MTKRKTKRRRPVTPVRLQIQFLNVTGKLREFVGELEMFSNLLIEMRKQQDE